LIDMAQFSDAPHGDAATDAAQLLSRIGYAALALAAPSAATLSSRAMFLLYPVAIALLLVAASLDPVAGIAPRLRALVASPAAWAATALFAWAVLSLLWSPFPVPGAQRLLKIAMTSLAAAAVVVTAREHLRATDLYLFPIGVLLLMVTIFALWVGEQQGWTVDGGRIDAGGVAMAVLLFPAMGGLAARGRNGYARTLMLLGLIYAFAIGNAPITAAMLAGVSVLSFAVSDVERTVRDVGRTIVGLILAAPILLAFAPTLARLVFHAKLGTLGQPYAELAAAASLILHDAPRLVTGHGVDTVVQGVEAGLLPSATPRVALFEIWYELGILGALAAALAVWFGFRAIGRTAPRFSPYLAATFAVGLTFAVLSEGLAAMTWITLLAIGAISLGAAAHSQYRTTRPSASGLAHF
jgi:hypothetical protein